MILILNKMEFKASKYYKKGSCFILIKGAAHQEGIKIMSPLLLVLYIVYKHLTTYLRKRSKKLRGGQRKMNRSSIIVGDISGRENYIKTEKI